MEKRGPVTGRKAAQGGGVKAVFGLQHAVGKGGFGVAGQDRDAGLAKQGACVKVGGDLVHGAAGLRVACGKGAGMVCKPG